MNTEEADKLLTEINKILDECIKTLKAEKEQKEAEENKA